MKKKTLILYVSSEPAPSASFDREFLLHHHCARGHYSLAYQDFVNSNMFKGRILSEIELQAVQMAAEIQQKANIQVEIIDLSKSLRQRWKLRRQGIRQTPQFVYNGELLPPIESIDQLRNHFSQK